VSVFGKAFHNINHLNFSHCAITSDGAVKLVEALQQQRRKVRGHSFVCFILSRVFAENIDDDRLVWFVKQRYLRKLS